MSLDASRLLKCACCGRPYHQGCSCSVAYTIRAYLADVLAEREAEERELPRYEEMARRGVL